jgi:amino-acid N-acetyltransferase
MLKQGIGKQIVEYILEEAKELKLKKVFTLTYQPGFFEKSNFNIIEKETMPHKVWTDCINCPKFPNCNEICLEICI